MEGQLAHIGAGLAAIGSGAAAIGVFDQTGAMRFEGGIDLAGAPFLQPDNALITILVRNVNECSAILRRDKSWHRKIRRFGAHMR